MFYAWKVWLALSSKTKTKKLEAVQSENLQRASRSSQKSKFFCQKDQLMSLRWWEPTLEVFIHHKSANLIQKARLTAVARSGKSQMVQDSRE